MLIEYTLFGVEDKVAYAVNLLKENEPREGYFLAFSGGKDSTCIYHLAKMAGVKFDVHFHEMGGIDPPQLVEHVKKNYPDVIFDKPPVTMEELIIKYKIPPTRKARYCVKLKSKNGLGRIKITGIRAQESARRAKRPVVELCKDGTTYINPIIKWTTADIWQFIRQNHLPYCDLYDKGFSRLGCVLCPFQTPANTQRDLKFFPTVAEYLRDSCRKSFEVNKESLARFSSGDDMFEWWLGLRGSSHRIKDTSFDLFDSTLTSARVY